jgi:hypothetical protein
MPAEGLRSGLADARAAVIGGQTWQRERRRGGRVGLGLPGKDG